MTRSRMAQHLPAAVKFIEQGHIRIGPDIVTDPAFLVTRLIKFFLEFQLVGFFHLEIRKISFLGLTIQQFENNY